MPEPNNDFREAVHNFDRAALGPGLQKAKEERQEIIKRFPLSDWPQLPIERYALGLDGSDDSFCNWLERKSLELGSIRGGSSKKFLVYKRRGKPGWYFGEEYKDEQEAWQSIRRAFVQAFEKAQRGEWDTIDDMEALHGGAALRLKTLYVYFPDEIFPIFSQPHIKHFFTKLNLPTPAATDFQAVKLNRTFLKAIQILPEFEGWSNLEVMRFLYNWVDPRETRRVVKIAPGEDAKFWDDCLKNQYICVGWDEVGDLLNYEDKEAFLETFRSSFLPAGYTASKCTEKANELWTLMELEAGDIIVANKGTSRVLAIGEVIEPGYQWRPERHEYKHSLKVRWDTSYAKDIPTQKRWALKTILKVPLDLYSIIRSTNTGQVALVVPPTVDPIFLSIENALERKGQVILYGPPGTGKTYIARRFAVWWLYKKRGAKDPAALLVDPPLFAQVELGLSTSDSTRVESDSGSVGQFTLVTFHPSYSYEDFVEGYRPVDSGTQNLQLRLEDGIFKRVCNQARLNPEKKYILLIDEINRAHVAKVFGELITLLEKDKRGVTVRLPQSREKFFIPPNVFILGTMNTADRSIKLLDAALRRRFAFVELMPDSELLQGVKIQDLSLDEFLNILNARISEREGREKQIGHSFFMRDGQPISDSEEFSEAFRQEILPLLQEYCYDNYGDLQFFLGERLVNKAGQCLNEELLRNTDNLLAALAEQCSEKK